MDRSTVSSSSKQTLDYYESYDFEMLKEDGETKIENFTEALKKDSELCSFMKNCFSEGTQHATMSPRKRKFAVVEESWNKEGTTTGETTKEVDQTNWAKYFWCPANPIEKLMQDHRFAWSIADRVGNDEELVAIAEKILKPFRQDSVTCSISSFDAHEYSQIVDLFLENNIFTRHFSRSYTWYYVMIPDTFSEISTCTQEFVEEPPEDRIARIKMNRSLGKLFEGGDGPVAKLCGAQTILFGFWASRDSLAKLGQRVYSPDLPNSTRRGLKGWINKRRPL